MALSPFAAELPPKPAGHLTVKQVAARLAIAEWTVYDWARSGRLPCIRMSRKALRFAEADIAKFERAHTTGRIK